VVTLLVWWPANMALSSMPVISCSLSGAPDLYFASIIVWRKSSPTRPEWRRSATICSIISTMRTRALSRLRNEGIGRLALR
jgi:hypothetical protein